MPVKDSLETTEKAVRAVVHSGYTLTIYDDYSSPDCRASLDNLCRETGCSIIHIADHFDHPSPNYRWVLIDAQREAIRRQSPLLIIESDVVVGEDTIKNMLRHADDNCGMIAAVTHDAEGQVNFPYQYAKHWKQETIDTRKRISFCCTLLTLQLLQALPFETLNEQKNWFDVTISHRSIQLGLRNLLLMQVPVLHTPHSSRPWKQLKYTHPLRYYWEKIIHRRDRI